MGELFVWERATFPILVGRLRRTSEDTPPVVYERYQMSADSNDTQWFILGPDGNTRTPVDSAYPEETFREGWRAAAVADADLRDAADRSWERGKDGYNYLRDH